MNFFGKLISPKELENIFGVEMPDDGIRIGELSSYDPEMVIKLMNLWARKVDKLIELDIEVHSKPTWMAHTASKWRGFTYTEYSALFNQHILPEEFPYYPIFNALRKNKGGVISEKQRTDFIFHFDLNEEDYVRLLLKEGFEPLLSFFFGKLRRLSVQLPLKKLWRHLFICGPTGSGKSELMRVIFYRLQKKYSRYSLILIDPHGDLAENVKKSHLNTNKERLIYIDPFFKKGYTPTFNPFEIKDRSIKNISHTVEQNILAYEEVLSREGGKLTEAMINMLEKCLYFLLERPGSTIMDLVELLRGDEELAQEAQEYDSFFDKNFLKPNNRTREALFNRISRLLNSPALRNFLVGNSTFDLEHAINNGKIVIFNLADLGEMTQVAVGKFIVASIKSIVRKRKKGGSLHTFLMVDEAHVLISGSFEYILSQLRGFGLHMVMGCQYVEQLGNQTKAVRKNVAIKFIAGEETDDLKDIITVPKDAILGDYEFFLKVRNRPLTKFKSPDLLLKHRKKYELTEEQEKALDEYQLERYYKVIGNDDFKNQEVEGKNDLVNNDAPKPPFELFLGENDQPI